MKVVLAAILLLLASTTRADAPNGVQEIAGQIGYKPKQMKNCAFWANEAAAAARSRDKGVKQDAAEEAIPLSARPTDWDADLHARRVEVVAQVYESDNLQKMSPKKLHDSVFDYCVRDNQ